MDHCPGLYCGRTLSDSGVWSECGACPRGFRTNSSFCLPCSDVPEFYDWLYLAFMVLVALVLHWFCIDYIASRQRLRGNQSGVLIHPMICFMETLCNLSTLARHVIRMYLQANPMTSLLIICQKPLYMKGRVVSSTVSSVKKAIPAQDFTIEVCIVHISAVIEICVSAVATVLIVEPIGSFQIKSCKTVHFSDWYTLFYNPNPNYEKTLYCTQEAVFPLYTMVFIFYAVATVVMLLIRPKYYPHGKLSVYAALYFYPILAFFQAVFGGIIYYTFPYIVIIASLISSATHLAHRKDQSMFSLIGDTVGNTRNLVILIGHWLFNAYGIIAITELKDPKFHWSLLALVPLPTVFYILTAKFTDPSKLHVE